MSAREQEVGRPCTSSCVEEESRRTVVVPGIRWRNWATLPLSEVALTVSMVIRVRSLFARQTTRWMRVALRAVLILSLMATTEEVRVEPSL
jgi:hypothetical protein